MEKIEYINYLNSKNYNNNGRKAMREDILKFLESKKDVWVSAGVVARKLNANVITTSKHLRKLEEDGEIKSIEADILLIREGLDNVDKKGRVQKIKLYRWYENDGCR